MQELILGKTKISLEELMRMIECGEEVIIKQRDGSSYKIVPVSKNTPVPKFGSAKGLISISEDFDAPVDDFREYSS
ncbi:MAG TPA: DUF2281 domain-containing protein [bacterium]|nr:DUF2281 domain-containing protein [bacterium]